MKSPLLRVLVAVCAVSSMLLLGTAARADDGQTDPNFDGKFHASVTPYLWVPTFNGTFRYNLSDIHDFAPNEDRSFDSNIGPNKYLSKLNFALMFNAQLRQGNYALVTDFINLNAGNQTSSITNLSGPRNNFNFNVSGNASSTMVGTIWTIAPSGTVFRHGLTNVNVELGTRLVWLKASTDFHLQGQNDFFPLNGSAEKRANYGNIIWGTYGNYAMGNKWAIPFYGDVGTGTPALTWQAILGVRYGQLSATYRYLDYEADKSSDTLLQNLRLNGPQIGYTFHF